MATASALSEVDASALPIEPAQHFVIYNVSWDEYEALLKLWEGRSIHLTYDRGTLELMTKSYRHENIKGFLGRLIETLTLELGMEVAPGGEMTFKRQLKERGLEPDNCF
jgi:Uma2 family endonuclease